MKILYISPYLGFSGYSAAARGYVRALYNQDVDVVLRNIKYDDGQEYQLEDWDRKLFTRSSNDIDVIIQHITPNEMAMEVQPGVKNIACVATETTRVSKEWVEPLNKMDAVITFCDMAVDCFKNSGVTVPVYKVPHTFDISKYETRYEPFNTVEVDARFSGKDKLLTFYNIAQWSNKKAVDLALRAYYREFQNDEDVVFYLKGYIGQMSRVNEEKQLVDVVNSIKGRCKLPNYPPIYLMTDILSEEEMSRVHATGDVFVNTSHGEAWGIPIFDAAAFGNAIITHTWGGPGEFLNDDEIYKVDHVVEPVYDVQHPFPYMYTGLEDWSTPTIQGIRSAMRQAYEDHKAGQLRQGHGKIKQFDYSEVGPQLVKVIEEVVNGSNNR
jgi:glycosyltransferase involved in cell wall biosynthesis